KYPLSNSTLFLSADNKWFAIGKSNYPVFDEWGKSSDLIHVANLSDRIHARSIGANESHIQSRFVSADGCTLAGYADQMIRLWDVASGKLRLSIPWRGEFDEHFTSEFGGPSPPVLA